VSRFAPAILAAAAALGYLVFLPDRLGGWDPLQFALGLTDFSMPMHQPHPPGYVGHMALGWILTLPGLGPDRAIQLASLLATAGTVALVYLLGRRLHDEATGLAGAILFAVNPVTAWHAVSGESYAAEALVATAIVLLGLGVGRGASRWRLATFFLVFGLAGGVRQSLPLFLFPFAAWRLVVACRGRSPGEIAGVVAMSGLAGVAGILAWGVPLSLLAGGLVPLASAFGNQFFSLFGAAYSPLMGASRAMVLTNLDVLWRHAVGGVSISGGVAAILLPAAWRRLAPGLLDAGTYLAWIAPPFLWFLLMFIRKSGHVLLVVPAFSLAAAVILTRSVSSRGLRAALVAGVAAAQAGLFLAPPAWWTQQVSTCSAPELEYDEAHTRRTVAALRELAAGEPDGVLVVTRDDRFHFRKAMYYLPESPSLFLMDPDSTGAPRPGVEVCEARERRASCRFEEGFWYADTLPDRAVIPLSPRCRAIAWFADPRNEFRKALVRSVPLREVDAGSVSAFFVTDLPAGPVRLAVGPYLFERAGGSKPGEPE
jgi:hypothetical protein